MPLGDLTSHLDLASAKLLASLNHPNIVAIYGPERLVPVP